MTIKELFTKYLSKGTDVEDAINELVEIIDTKAAEYTDGQNVYLDVLGNEIRGFKDNDNFYIFGINKHQFNEQQFDY